MPLYENNSSTAGNTPLVRLNRIVKPGTTVYVKVEGRNPAFSVKDRVGVALIEDAEARGLLQPGGNIVEPTSGNTGIGLAFVAAARGYSLTLTMPESMSIERRKVLAMLGAKLELTPAAEGMSGAIRKAEELASGESGKWYMPRQFDNPANPAVHERITGPEIWKDTEGNVDVFVAGVGTGGTISGVAQYLKRKQGKPVTIVAVEPAASPVITQHLNGQPNKPSPHAIQGIGAGFIPKNLDLSLIDRVEQVTNEEALEWARRLAKEEGILAGISSGAAVAVALRLAELPEFEGKTIVTVLPDAGERYMSSALFAGIGE